MTSCISVVCRAQCFFDASEALCDRVLQSLDDADVVRTSSSDRLTSADAALGSVQQSSTFTVSAHIAQSGQFTQSIETMTFHK